MEHSSSDVGLEVTDLYIQRVFSGTYRKVISEQVMNNACRHDTYRLLTS